MTLLGRWFHQPSIFYMKHQVIQATASLSTCFFQVADDSGDERVVEPQRTLPVHARCQVVMKTNMIIMVIVINDQGKKENQSAHDSHCQVLVVGGGPSGLSAALAARRAGAEVILMERLFIIIMIICNTL